uniref:Uncharacterized protein n=1 Tax=Rhizophora mucronata TaxID=61149 RepID=A0A2P2IW75_RHIMU
MAQIMFSSFSSIPSKTATLCPHTSKIWRQY